MAEDSQYKDRRDHRKHRGLKTTEEFIANGTVETNLGGDATFDMYYRGNNGKWMRIPANPDPLVNEGRALTFGAGVPSWNPVFNNGLAQMNAHTFKGNNTAFSANPTDLTSTQLTAELNLFTSALKGLVPASGGGTINFLRADGVWAPPPGTGTGGEINTASNLGITTYGLFAAKVVEDLQFKSLRPGTGISLSATATEITITNTITNNNQLINGMGFITGNQVITLSGDITGSGATSISSTIAPNVVTNSKLAQMAAHTFKGNNTAGTGSPLDLTATQLTAELNVFSSALKGLTPASGGGTTAFLRADGTWSPTVNQTITLSGDVTGSGTTSISSTIAPNVVDNTKLAQMAAHTFKGNNTGITANAIDLTATELTAELNLFTSTLKGLVPLSGGGTANFLRADGTWATPPGTGSLTINNNVNNRLITATGTAALDAETNLTFDGVTLSVSFNATAWAPGVLITNTAGGTVAYTQMGYVGTARTWGTGVANSTETNFGIANRYFIYDQTGNLMRFSIDTGGVIYFHAYKSGFSPPTTSGTTRNIVVDANGLLSHEAKVNQTITLTGDVTGSGTSSFATTIAANVVTNAKLATMPAHTFKGNNTGATGNVLNLTATELTAELNVFSATLKGLVPLSGGGTTNYLRADGVWAAPPGGGSSASGGADNFIYGTGAGISDSVNWKRGTATIGTGVNSLDIDGAASGVAFKVSNVLKGMIYAYSDGHTYLSAVGNLHLNSGSSTSFVKFTGLIGGDGIVTPTAYIHAPASTTSYASLRLPSGVAPTTPNHGDMWTDASHIYARLNGVSYQLDQQGGGGVSAPTDQILYGVSGTSYTSNANYKLNTGIIGSNISSLDLNGIVGSGIALRSSGTLKTMLFAYSDGHTYLTSIGNLIFTVATGGTVKIPQYSTSNTAPTQSGTVMMLTNDANGLISWQAIPAGGGGVSSVSGTPNRITSSGGATPVIDIASNYVGQTSITTLSTITTGNWNAGYVIANGTLTMDLNDGTNVSGLNLKVQTGSTFIAPTTTYGMLWVAPGGTLNFHYNGSSIDVMANRPITLTGDVTGSGGGSFAATIANNAVTNAKLAQMAAHTFKGNNTGSTANAADLSATQLTAELNLFTSALKGVVPASGGSATQFLCADGTWKAIAYSAITGPPAIPAGFIVLPQVSTTGSETINLGTYTPASNERGIIQLYVSSMQTDLGGGYTRALIVRYQNVGGTIAISSTTLQTGINDGTSVSFLGVDFSGGSIRFRVTGTAGNPTLWDGHYMVTKTISFA